MASENKASFVDYLPTEGCDLHPFVSKSPFINSGMDAFKQHNNNGKRPKVKFGVDYFKKYQK